MRPSRKVFFYCLSLLLVGGGEVVRCVLAVRTHRVDVAVLKLKVLVFDFYEIEEKNCHPKRMHKIAMQEHM